MRKALIAKIHIAKKELNLDDETYRGVLSHLTDESSCSKMNDSQLKRVVQYFKTKGFQVKSANGKRMSPHSSETVKTPEIRKIRAIWITMNLHGFVRDNSESALDAYVKRMSANHNNGKGVDSVGWLSGELAHKVLEAMKAWHKRVALKRLAEISITQADGVPLNKMSYAKVIDIFQASLTAGQL